MDLPGYDAWKLATPPEYERDGDAECDCLSPDDMGMLCLEEARICPCECHRRVKVICETPPEYEREEGPSAEPEQSSEEPQLPCPHSRPSWRLCPWCLSINLPVDPDVSW